MPFSEDLLDEIRERLPVSEVVGRRVKLRRQGREWAGLSPFTKEKTPSFFVNDQKGFYHDFSSNRHGDIFRFVMETEGLSFPEAVERLAVEAGVDLPLRGAVSDPVRERRKSILEIIELAVQFFEAQLLSRDGERARAYLARRQIAPATQREFRLGFAPPGRTALKQHLLGKGVSQEMMIEAGLVIAGDNIAVPYDRFRDRLIIPIQDSRGRVVAFGGRALSDDVVPKYLNSAESAHFHKGSLVFNLHRAREPAFHDGSVVVVEGYLDAITVYQAGLRSVVATMGTSFTEDQIEALWRISPEPIVCFDADRAGLSAANRAVDRILPLLRPGKTFRFAFLVEGKDPDELIRDRGVGAFKAVLEGSRPLWDVLWERESALPVDTPDARAALEARLYALIATIKDRAIQANYRGTARIALSELFWDATRRQKPFRERGKAGSKLLRSEVYIEREGFLHGIQKIVLGMVVHCPTLIDTFADDIVSIDLDLRLENFRRALYNLLIDSGARDVAAIYESLGDDYYRVLKDIHGDARDRRTWGVALFRRFPVMSLNPPDEFVADCLRHFVHYLRIAQMRHHLAMDNAELSSALDDIDQRTERIIHLKALIGQEEARLVAEGARLADEAKEIHSLAAREAPGLHFQAA